MLAKIQKTFSTLPYSYLHYTQTKRWSGWGTQPIAEFEEKIQRPHTLRKDISFATRQLVLMRFLQFPKIAKSFAQLSFGMIQKGGLTKKVVEIVIAPLTKSFSAGDNTSNAVKKAFNYLSKNQLLLLDFAHEMIENPKDRQISYNEINRLLDEISKTTLLYLPIKLTSIIDHTLLEKVSRNEELNRVEQISIDDEIKRLYLLAEKAEKSGKIIFIDQEYPHQKAAIFKLAVDLMERFNTNRPVVYITIQATDIECFSLLTQLLSNPLIHFPGVKLVNGAYVDWAHQNGYGKMMQPCKMAAFTAFVLMARFCLKNHIHLYMGTHNLILEQLVDEAAVSLNISKNLYLKGQLYGFTTKENLDSRYVIFGSTSACISYSLRRVIEGAGSSGISKAPPIVLNNQEIKNLIKNSALNEQLSEKDVELIIKAIQFDVQSARVKLARNKLYELIRFWGNPQNNRVDEMLNLHNSQTSNGENANDSAWIGISFFSSKPEDTVHKADIIDNPSNSPEPPCNKKP